MIFVERFYGTLIEIIFPITGNSFPQKFISVLIPRLPSGLTFETVFADDILKIYLFFYIKPIEYP